MADESIIIIGAGMGEMMMGSPLQTPRKEAHRTAMIRTAWRRYRREVTYQRQGPSLFSFSKVRRAYASAVATSRG